MFLWGRGRAVGKETCVAAKKEEEKGRELMSESEPTALRNGRLGIRWAHKPLCGAPSRLCPAAGRSGPRPRRAKAVAKGLPSLLV